MGFYYSYKFDFGEFFIVQKDLKISFAGLNYNKKGQLKETELIKKTYSQLREYFDGKRKSFDIPLLFEGSEFQKKVWQELVRIPYGKTLSYKDIAERISNPKAYRAVGGACNKNPILILVPCHRVVGSGGNLTGFALGLDLKDRLLKLEEKYV